MSPLTTTPFTDYSIRTNVWRWGDNMVINECACYEDNLWYAYDLKDGNGQYKEEERLFMRKESQNHKFSCPDCGEELILCAGPIMEPFFKHHEQSNCIMRQADSKHRNLAVRRMMYFIAKNSFPVGYIEANRKVGEHACADFLITALKNNSDISDEMIVQDTDCNAPISPIALNYLGHEMKLSLWEEIHEEFDDNQIEDIWFLNYRKYQNMVSTTFEYLLTKNNRPIILINDEEQTITLKIKMNSPTGGMYFLAKKYELSEIRIGEDGSLLTDFADFCQSEIQDILKREEEESRAANELAVRKREKEELYRRRETQVLEKKKEDITVSYKAIPKKEGTVQRRSMSEGPVMSKEMKMHSIREYWRLPDLTGLDWVIKRADMLRFGFLKNLDQELAGIHNKEVREQKIQFAIATLECNCNASAWK